MKKTSLSFRAVRCGSYLYRFFLGKMSRRRLRGVAVAAGAAVCITSASAQCNVFKNADEMNPLLSVLPAGKKISGLDFADINADGLLDCYVRFDSDNKLTLYRNIGSLHHPVFVESKKNGFGNIMLPPSTGLYLSANQYMQFVDIDGDGDLDFFVTSQDDQFYGYANVIYYENIGTNKVPHFVENDNDNPAGVAGCYYYVAFKFADIDGDGDYDLYYNYQGQYGFNTGPSVYMNTGTKFSPHFVDYSYTICACYGDGRTYYDWNTDGLLDYFTVNEEPDIKPDFYKNIGPKEAPRYILDNDDKPKFRNGTPYRMIDLNNDGSPEVFASDGRYSVLTPVAAIKDSVLQNDNTALYNENKNAAYTYRWELNGKAIAGANKYYIVPKQSGIYTLYVTSGCGTGVSLNYEFMKTNTQFLADDKTASFTSINGIAVKAYPNPFTSSITLQLPGFACTVKITDVAGRVLLTQNTSATTIQLGERLKAGTYMIEVWADEKRVYQTTVVKQ